MEFIIYLLLIIIIISSILGISYIIIYNKIQSNIIRINESESIIDESLRKRFDLIINAETIISENVKIELDAFNEIKELKNKKVSNFDFDRKSTECINLVMQIKKDYSTLENNREFKDLVQELKDIEERLESAKCFYNKYTSNLNHLIRKFPSNIISRIHHIIEKKFFDNKDMADDLINDFKI